MPLMDLSTTVNRMATGIYPVTRYGQGSYVNGRYTPGATSVLQVRAAVQIAEGRDLLLLPEGLRTRETIVLFTQAQLQTGKAPLSGGNDADVVTYNGSLFEVVLAEDRSGHGNYYRSIAVKRGQ